MASSELFSAVLMATTWGELNPNILNDGGYLKMGRAIELDRSAALTRETALLVGFTEKDAGPARLCWREAGIATGGWRAITPTEARVMYRFGIPVVSP